MTSLTNYIVDIIHFVYCRQPDLLILVMVRRNKLTLIALNFTRKS